MDISWRCFDASVQHSKWIAKLGGLGYDYLILLNRFVNWCLFKIGKEPYSFSKKIKASKKSSKSTSLILKKQQQSWLLKI
jgi:hypothetical protein